MITTRDKETFQSRGLVRVMNFLSARKFACARQVILDHLEREGIRRDGARCLDEFPPSTLPRVGTKLIKRLKAHKEIANLIGDEVYLAVAELLDGRKSFPLATSQVLFTLPNAETWTVPHQLWHMDLPRLPDCGIPGVQIFTFLDTVAPGGGGTLVVAGSHRLVNENRRISSQQAKKILKREPYFRALMSGEAGEYVDRLRFLHEPGYVGDVELQVVELYGEPGDVFFADLRLLHTIAPNAAPAPRIMLTQRFLLETLRTSF